MAWGNKNTLSSGFSLTSSLSYPGAGIALNPGESAHVQVLVNWGTNTTLNVVCAIEATLDAATEQWDWTPIYEFYIPNSYTATTYDWVSFLISGVYKFRLGMRVDGLGTLFGARAYYRVDGISL